MQKSVREWTLTLPSELSFWELKSQWIPKFLEGNFRGQNSLDWRFLYIIEKLLECKCLKWAHMTHLDTWNISYGQKKGQESNWQFDSRPLKVGNRPNFLALGDMRYIVEKILKKITTLFQTSFRSEVCTQNYGSPKLRESQVWEFQDSHLGIPGQNAIWMWALWRGTKYTIRGKVVASPKSKLWWVLWVWVHPWFILAPKVLKLCTKQLVVWFVQVHVSNWCLSLFLVPISELQHAPLPPKCYEPRSVPYFLILSLFPP
jgi:hypothetical protein